MGDFYETSKEAFQKHLQKERVTKDEALKMGIWAMHSVLGNLTGPGVFEWEEALEAMKQALEQPEPKPMHPEIRKAMEDYFDRCFNEWSKGEWVGLTEDQFLEASRMAEEGNYMVAFQRIQQWLKEKNV